MESYLKKIIRMSSYAGVLLLVGFFGVFGLNKKDSGEYTIDRASADVPYSQAGYYSQSYYGDGGDDGGDCDGGDGGDDCN
ncbi:MAG: hypothetical protein WD509_03025 [Candidatus Paceibacterota bacterium]